MIPFVIVGGAECCPHISRVSSCCVVNGGESAYLSPWLQSGDQPSRPCAWQPCRVNGVHFLPKFRLRSLQIGSPGACDLEFPVVNLSAFVHVQLVDELDLSRSVPAISILGALAQIVRRNSLVVQSDLDFAAFVSCPVSDNR